MNVLRTRVFRNFVLFFLHVLYFSIVDTWIVDDILGK